MSPSMRSSTKLLAALLMVVPAASYADDALLEQLEELAELLPGTYDNSLQVATQANMGVDGTLRLPHQTMTWTRVERPANCCAGDFAGPEAVFFYTQTYRNGKLWLLGEHIVAVYPDKAESALRLQNIRIANPQKWVGLDRDLDKQRNVELAPAGVDLHCKVLWRKTGQSEFVGELKGGGCDVVSGMTGLPRRLEMKIGLARSGMTYMDRGLDNGVVAYGSPEAIPFSMQRLAQ